MTNRERLHKAIRSLPLDRWQHTAADEGIDNLLEEEASEIADRLESALNRLPDTVRGLKAAIAEAAVEIEASKQSQSSASEPIMTDAVSLTNTEPPAQDLSREDIADVSLVAAIFYDKNKVAKVRRQLVERLNTAERDIYLFFWEEDNSQVRIKRSENFQPIELSFGWLFICLIVGFVGGIGIIFVLQVLSWLIPIFSTILSVGGYIIYELQKSYALKTALKETVVSLYGNRLQVGEFLLVIKITAEKNSIIDLLKQEDGKEIKVRDNKPSVLKPSARGK